MIKHAYIPHVLYAAMAQAAPFIINGVYALIAFWIVTIVLFISSFYPANLILIMKKKYYIIISVILSTASILSCVYLESRFISSFLISCISLTLFGIWPYFRGFLRILFWPAVFGGKGQELSLGDYIAVISCGIRKFHNDLSDATTFSLTRNNNIFSYFFESSLTLLMLILRFGDEVSKAFKIRYFSLHAEGVVAQAALSCYLAWSCCVCLLVILMTVWQESF